MKGSIHTQDLLSSTSGQEWAPRGTSPAPPSLGLGVQTRLGALGREGEGVGFWKSKHQDVGPPGKGEGMDLPRQGEEQSSGQGSLGHQVAAQVYAKLQERPQLVLEWAETKAGEGNSHSPGPGAGPQVRAKRTAGTIRESGRASFGDRGAGQPQKIPPKAALSGWGVFYL